MSPKPRYLLRRALAAWLAAWLAFSPLGTAGAATTALGDVPVLAAKKVPPNLLLDLSVEWPTGVVAAYNDNLDTTVGFTCPGREGDADPVNKPGGSSSATNGFGRCYFDDRTYLGYFDPKKCYDYVGTPGNASTAPSPTSGYFTPAGPGSGPNFHQCSAKWSGNFLNWATMQAIDTFRSALTGGDRVVDTATQTIVEKARHSGQGGYRQFPVKKLNSSVNVSPSTVTPKTSSSLFLRVHNGSDPFTKFYAGAWDGPQFQICQNTAWNSSDACSLETYYLRVEVCKSGMLEPNCVSYGSSSKPTGLIQQNADRMRFGVFGYLLDSASERAGGVLRAKLKDLGPKTINPVGPGVPNSRREFKDTDGTYINDPDSLVSATAGINSSGVINYLNKFGKASTSYKSRDTISEMYYESLRYLTNKPSATAEYTTISPITNAMRDGFPVITTWAEDPIQYACQKNYVIMIADVNAHCDYALPGSVLNDGGSGHCTSSHPTTVSDPPTGLSTPTSNVATFTKKVGELEAITGYDNLHTRLAPIGTSRRNTWYLAGLAFWANTTNLRPDLTTGTDRVTAQTYMVDVAETGSWFVNHGTKKINQMWLAAKYGGFDDSGFTGSTAPPASTWDKNSDGTPDNYFLASRPDLMASSLTSVFADVLSKTESAAGATLISSEVTSGDSVYQVEYNSNGWIGEVFGSQITFPSGVPTVTPAWSPDARGQLDALHWDTGRRIATFNGAAGVPFRIADLTAAQQAALGTTTGIQQEVLNFLRGDRSKESSAGGPYRTRKAVLGDIVSSEATAVAAPQATYTDGTNPGYSTFRAANSTRQKMVYVGANDGMLHAFNGQTPGGGNEMFAYVPSFLFNGPSTPATPSVDGLAALAQPGYTHRFYVDATPVAVDVDFARTGGNPSLVPVGTFDWHTILVGGLGKGGKGIYALDVTDPVGMALSEAVLKTKVLWEFTDPDLGFTFGKPAIAKLRQYGWVVMVASGYNNVSGPNPGKGFLYILNAKTGALLQKISTGVGSALTPSGLTQISGYTTSFVDFTVEQVYGGDLLGNVWRFDVSSPTADPYPAPVKIAELKDSLGNPQPVTTAPRIEIGLNGVTRWIFIGTGQMLDSSDLSNTQTQTMYAFKDGTKSSPAGTPPTPMTFPLQRADFVPISDAELLTGVTVPPTKIGWLHDLTGLGPAGATERIGVDPVANAGTVAWVGNIPSTDPCSPGVSSRIYAVNYDTGRTALLDVPGGSTRVSFISDPQGLVKLQFIKVGDRVQLLSSDRGRKIKEPPSEGGGAAQPPRRLNWREIIN